MNIIPGKILVKRGLKANLPVLDPGEPAYCEDTKEYFIGTPEGNVLVGSQTSGGGDTGGGSGSGVLVYNTLTELQTAYPGGTSQPVWIVEENSWYYWEGTVTPPADTAAPVLTITAGGTFTGTKPVSMSTNETADIFYTLDGSTPTTASAKYTGTLSINATTTLKAIARDTAGNISTVQIVTYTLDETTEEPPADTTAPVLTITPAQTFTEPLTVNMSTDDPTAKIYYTLDDSDPKVSETKIEYTGPLTITETDTVKAYAVDTAGNASAVQIVTYTKNTTSTAIVSDDFNRANNTSSLGVATTGQTWANYLVTLGINNNQAYNTGAGGNGEAVVESGVSNASVEADFIYGSASPYVGIVTRYIDSNNTIVARMNSTGLALFKFINGTATQLGTTHSLTPVTGTTYNIKVITNGSDISVYLGGVLVITATDSYNSTVTKHGFRLSMDCKADNFKIQ